MRALIVPLNFELALNTQSISKMSLSYGGFPEPHNTQASSVELLNLGGSHLLPTQGDLVL